MCDPTGSLSFYDSNDVISFSLGLSPWSDAAFKADLINYIKTRMASVPGIGTVHAKEETRGNVDL